MDNQLDKLAMSSLIEEKTLDSVTRDANMMKLCLLSSLLVCLVSGFDDLAVLYAESKNASESQYFCTMFNHRFQPLPATRAEAEVLKVRDLTPSVLCDDPSDDPKIKNKLTLVSRGNCTFLEKANLTQRYGGRALVIVSEEGLLIPGVGNDEHYDEISIPVAVLSSSDHSIMTQKMGPDFHVQLFSPNGPRVDYNLILIWVLAVGTVILGSIWSGKVRQKLWILKRRRRSRSGDSGAAEEGEEEEDDQTGDLDVSPTTLMVFVVLMCGMLVSLYFFYDYLVYVLIGLFVVASSTSMYAVLKLALIRMPCIGTCKIPENRIPLLKTRPEIRRIILFLLCLAFGIFWAVERHESYAWILQDILGIFFCINMMKTIRMPSFKACTVLLCMLFVYDIFFVFITPLFTKSGESIMVDVATGGSSHSGEMLPMVLKVPRFMLRPETRACTLPHSLLGFGDILVPGLLVSYNFGFDLIVGSSKTYFIVSAIGYGLGLITTFIALALMATGQPALLYLVPFTLLPTLVVAVKRKEVKRLWEGPEYGDKEETPSNSSTSINQPSSVVTSDPGARVSPTIRRTVSREFNRDGTSVDSETTSQVSTDNEQQHLINR